MTDFPANSGPHHRVSVAGGSEPEWSRDGSELYYRSRGNLMAAAVGAIPSFTVLERRNLFLVDGRFRTSTTKALYAAAPDGRFLMIRSDASDVNAPVIILNFFELLH